MTKVLTCVYSLYTKDDTFLHDPISDVVCVRYESLESGESESRFSVASKSCPSVNHHATRELESEARKSYTEREEIEGESLLSLIATFFGLPQIHTTCYSV